MRRDWCMARLTQFSKTLFGWKPTVEIRNLLLATAIFFVAVLLICLNRHYTFYSSYDHGLFNQIFWNNLHGRWFQSSLTGANSYGALYEGKIPDISFLHLGQHFVPDFLLWLPLYALAPYPVTLVVLQVALMTAGGVVLYFLARHYLSASLALMITISYYGAVAVLGPTFANFYEHCQIPLFMFGTLLALEKQRWGWFWVLAVLVLGVREDAGFMLFSLGLYLLVRRRHPRVAVALCVISFLYVAIITSQVMPQFSNDNPKLYMAIRFRQFVEGVDHPTTLQVLWGMLTHPRELLVSIVAPVDRKLFYLFRQWLPLAFIPALSLDAWILSATPLLSIFLQTGETPLAIVVRYAIAVVPGVFYGTTLWWAQHPDGFRVKFRRFWAACLALSILFAIGANPNRTFSFLIPDSFVPWVHVSLPRQWDHGNQIRQVLRSVPPEATVSTTTYVIPHLSSRRVLIRLPEIRFLDEQKQEQQVEYLLADLWQLQEYQVAFSGDRARLVAIATLFDDLLTSKQYGVQVVQDGVVLLRRGVASQPEALTAWTSYRKSLEPILQKAQS